MHLDLGLTPTKKAMDKINFCDSYDGWKLGNWSQNHTV